MTQDSRPVPPPAYQPSDPDDGDPAAYVSAPLVITPSGQTAAVAPFYRRTPFLIAVGGIAVILAAVLAWFQFTDKGSSNG